MPEFNINNNDIVKLTNKLEQLHRSAMPVTVRKSLNEVAFVTKKETIKPVFESKFTIRQKRFITSHTAANRSKNTFSLKEMYSEVGVIKDKSKAGNRLELQEFGGSLANREKIPQKGVRVAKSERRKVSKKFYLKNIKARSKGGKFSKKGIISKNKRITILKTKKAIMAIHKGGRWEMLYLLDQNIDIKQAQFLAPASEKAFKQMPEIFTNFAKKRIKRGFR